MPIINLAQATPVALTPANRAINSATDSSIQANFSIPLKPKSGSLIINNGQGDIRRIAVHDGSQISIEGFAGSNTSGKYYAPSGSITIKPQKRLLSNSRYYVQFDTGVITDFQGNALPGIYDSKGYYFTTSADTTPPQAVDANIHNQSTQVSTQFELRATFNEAIKWANSPPERTAMLFGTGIKLSNAAGDLRSVGGEIVGNTLILSSNSNRPLFPNSRYTLQFPATTLTDLASNPFAGVADNGFSFTTGNNDTTPPLLENIEPYAEDQSSVGSDIVLRPNELIKPGQGVITLDNGQGDSRKIDVNDSQQVKFYRYLPDNPVPQLTKGYGEYLVIDPLQNLKANSKYSVQLSSQALTDLAGNRLTLSAQPFANYITTGKPDNQPPVPYLQGFSSQIPLQSTLNISFDELIKAGNGFFTLSNGQGDTRHINVNDRSQVTIDLSQLRISPRQKLLPGTKYYLLADAGAITDLAGNAFAGTQDKNAAVFTTEGMVADASHPVTEINHGLKLGSYEAGDTLVFKFNTPIKEYRSFQLNQHTFGGNDVVLSTDGFSASVVLTADSNVAPGDMLTMQGCLTLDGYRNNVEFKL